MFVPLKHGINCIAELDHIGLVDTTCVELEPLDTRFGSYFTPFIEFLIPWFLARFALAQKILVGDFRARPGVRRFGVFRSLVRFAFEQALRMRVDEPHHERRYLGTLRILLVAQADMVSSFDGVVKLSGASRHEPKSSSVQPETPPH